MPTTFEFNKLSLLCSIIAIDGFNSVNTNQDKLETTNVYRTAMNHPIFIFSGSVENITSNRIIRDLVSSLIVTLKSTLSLNSKILPSFENDHLQLQQYLRRFLFLYCYYYINTYPNDLTKLSVKKINMLAVRNLFLIYNL